MNFLRRVGELLRRFYDRILAILAVVMLIGAIAWGVIRIGALQLGQRDFGNWMSAISPEHLEAPRVDVSPYEGAELALKEPPQFSVWSNALFVPETRCYCVDCMRPISLSTEVCPFCGFKQPPREPPRDLDSDYDGMTDAWEKEHGLDPRNNEDAQLDGDGDGFVNADEASGKTNPADPASHPAYAEKLTIGPVVAEPFRLLFKSVLSLPDGGKKFAINTRDSSKTYFVKLGQIVDGFEVFSFVEKFEDVDIGGVKRRANLSVLTLRREKKLIALTMGRERSGVEYRVSLKFALDGSDIPVKPGEPLDVRGESYKVITVDIPKETVVIERLSDHQRFDIRKPLQPAETAK
ncbi:MAG: hypothetical protein K8T26_11815 [Lentisphaerae bacterium]|nr:hypothetical protein [Lentisphaerota bacterium]